VKILCVATLPPHQGGSAISNSLLLGGFAAAGHTVHVLSPLSSEAATGPDRFAAAHPEIAVTRFPVPFAEVASNLPVSDGYRRVEREHIRRLLPQLIRQDRPDLVFIGRETFAWDVPDIARRHAIPCVLRTAGAMTIGMLQGSLPAADVRHLMAQYHKADLIICPAEHLAARLRLIGLSNIKVIWNAVDRDRFSPRPKDPRLMRRWSLTDADVVVAHVSNLKSLKRPLDVVDAAALAAHDPRLQYLVVGDGPVRHMMEDACRERQIVARFRFAGWIEHDAMPAYINLADVVVMPPEDEAQARVYLETQACGRVILASDIAAAREVITDGKTGVVFRMGDAADLAAKILRLADDAELRATIGRNARHRVAAHASPTIVRAYMDAFTDVLSRADNSPD
jgi:glycosyltransferase involved in cell wall biosynthesis